MDIEGHRECLPKRVVFVCKRFPQQRDLISRPYGRFYFLPTLLAGMGHEVRVLLASHAGLPSFECERDGVQWSSHDLRTLGPLAFLSRLRNEVEVFQPDWIVGCSDAWYGWLAQRITRRLGAKLAIDAYDNYEAYMPWNLPLHLAWRRALRAADVVTAAGPQLAERLQRSRHATQRPIDIVPMAADPEFTPRDRNAARQALGLPPDAPLIGYMGAWARNRGTDVLLEAFRLLRANSPAARLVLTGRPPAHALAEPGVLALGYIDDAQLPIALSALDMASVIIADSSFGRYSYPAKLCEAMASQTRVVATSTGPVQWMLNDDARFLVPVGNANELAKCMLTQLNGPRRITYPNLPTWNDSARRLEAALMGGASC
jgi:glycosyltransferase involved in cell wall biosynthesis